MRQATVAQFIFIEFIRTFILLWVRKNKQTKFIFVYFCALSIYLEVVHALEVLQLAPHDVDPVGNDLEKQFVSNLVCFSNKNRLCSMTCGIDNTLRENKKVLQGQREPLIYSFIYLIGERSHPKEKCIQGMTDPTPKRNLICNWWIILTDPTRKKILGGRLEGIWEKMLTLTFGLVYLWGRDLKVVPPTIIITTTTTLTVLWLIGFAAVKNKSKSITPLSVLVVYRHHYGLLHEPEGVLEGAPAEGAPRQKQH